MHKIKKRVLAFLSVLPTLFLYMSILNIWSAYMDDYFATEPLWPIFLDFLGMLFMFAYNHLVLVKFFREKMIYVVELTMLVSIIISFLSCFIPLWKPFDWLIEHMIG